MEGNSRPTFFCGPQLFSYPNIFSYPKLFLTQNDSNLIFFSDPNFFGTQHLFQSRNNFWTEAYANNPGLFMTILCPRLCVRLYCTSVHTDCDCTVVSLTDQSIASIQGTSHTHHTHTDRVKC